MQSEYASFEQIKQSYPAEWVLLGNPQMQGTAVIGGVVVYHSKDKKEVCYIGRDKTANFETVTIAFTGQQPHGRRIGILRRL